MFSLTHTYIPSDIPYKLVIILKGVHRQCDSVFFRYFFDHLNYSWRAKKISISFLSFKKFTRNYVVIYDKGSLCTLGFKKCLLLKYITISIHQTVILHVHSIIRVIRWRGRGGNREVMCTYGGGGESREVTCACRGGRGVTCTCDFTPVSAKDTRSIVQREPSSETMPASPSVMSSVFLSA